MKWRQSLRLSIESQWYNKPTWLWVFLPLVPVFWIVSLVRRYWLSTRTRRLSVPVVVVGNVSVGGTGKTPLLMSLVKFLQTQGLNPGVVSRGYGGSNTQPTLAVDATSDAQVCGDEPALIAQTCQCPVVVGRNRVQAAQRLITEFGCDLVLSDDGLQHYALARDIEIVVLDAQRGLGNGWRLPMGPLREGAGRLAEVDWVVTNGSDSQDSPRRTSFRLQPQGWRALQEQSLTPLTPYPWLGQASAFKPQPVFAVAAIGNPQRFFALLAQLGITSENYGFTDHHLYGLEDFAFAGDNPVLMTSKDAVKCRGFARPNWWALEVSAELPPSFLQALWLQLEQVRQSKFEETQ